MQEDSSAPDAQDPAGPAQDTRHAARYLELLVQGAPAEAYEGPASPERLHALRLRAELEGRRRREAELTALIETAHDLAGLRDLDDVLRAIVQRARSLLGTEVAYLTLTDIERGDTYMRVTEGSVSARFQQLRLGMGEGLGGLVAQTARPYVTDDYSRDARFQHTTSIDAGVGEEGLVAILGVPLTLGGQVIGVIYAADRRARVFEREQIALLSSFAAHAAIAIDTARLIAETRDAVAEVEAANRTIERAAEVHDRLTELVLRGGGVPEVLEALAEVLGGAVTFQDADELEGSVAEAVAEALQSGSVVASGEDEWVAAVSASGELLGALLLRGHAHLAPVDQLTLERAAMVTSLLQLSRRSASEAEKRVRGELLDDLLDAPHRDPTLLRERAARLGADLDTSQAVLAARLGGEVAGHAEEFAARQRLWSAASHLAATGHGLAAARDGGTVLLLPLSEGDTVPELARRTAAQLGAAVHSPVTVGGSAVGGGLAGGLAARPDGVATSYAEAQRCTEALHLLGRDGEGAAAEDFGFLGILLTDTRDGRDIDGFVTRTIGPVLAYDESRGTELAATLDAYFASGMSPARAKGLLHVHVNTVAQRLDRVAHLLGDDWQSPARALEIQLALRLHRLSTALGQ